MADPAREDQEPAPGFEADKSAGGRLVAAAVGAVSLVGGLTWILLNAARPVAWVDVGVGAVVAAGGLVLLMPHRVRLPHALAWPVAGGAGVLGTAAGVLSVTTYLCCMFVYGEGRGFPFRWLTRGAEADDPAAARRLAAGAGWDVDVASLLVNAFVWAYAGILILTVVTLVRRAVVRR